MKYQSKIIAILPLICMFVFYSCASVLPPADQIKTPEERKSAQIKCIALATTGGAAGGAAIGFFAGGKKNKAKGAVIGGLAGGALAFAIAYGECLDYFSTLESQPVADYQETVREINYDPAQGSVVKIKNFSLIPVAVAPGGAVDLKGEYYVMTPEETKEVNVTETRIIEHFDQEKQEFVTFGETPREVTVAQGKRTADGSINIPEKVPEGRYRIKFKVASSEKQDELASELVVSKETTTGASHSNTASNVADNRGRKGRPGKVKWYQSRMDEKQQGWVHGNYVEILEK